MRNSLICIFLSVFGLMACTEADDLTFREGDGVVVNFTTPGLISGEVGVTRADPPAPQGPEKLAKDVTVRILAYRRTGATANISSDTYIGENTYVADADGKLTACVVDANGKKITGTPTELRLIQGDYDFYAITPALPVKSSDHKTLDVKHGVDYATSLTTQSVAPGSGTVNLTTLDRKCSLLQFAIDRKSTNVTSVAIEEVSLTDMTNEPLSVLAGADLIVQQTTPKTQGITLDNSFFTITDQYKANGSKIVLPKWGADFKLGMKLKFNNSTTVTTLTPAKIEGLALAQGTRYIFKVKLLGGTVQLNLTVVGWEGDINVDAGDIGASNSLTINVGTWTDVNFDASNGNITGTTTGTWEGNVDWSTELGKNPGLTLPNTPEWIDGNMNVSTGGNTTGNGGTADWGDANPDGSSGNVSGDGSGSSWEDKPNAPDFQGGTNP